MDERTDRALARGTVIGTALAIGLSLLLYWSTAAPWLTWSHDGADGGDLIAAAMVSGVPHPSGYPTYCLLGRAFAQLPLGNIARRFTLFSGLAAAGSVGLVYLLACDLLRRGASDGRNGHRIALGAALVWATGSTLWSQAVIAEVYTLNALFASLLLYITLRQGAMERRHAWPVFGLLIGLGLGNHLTLGLLLPGLALMLWHKMNARRLCLFLMGMVAGLGVYLYVPLAARGHPPVSWGDAQDWAGFWWLVSGQLYRHFLFAVPVDTLPGRVLAWAQLWIAQVTLPGMALLFWGMWSRFRAGMRRETVAGLLTVALYSVYAVGYGTTDAYVYLLPAYLIGSLWLACGAARLGQSLGTQARYATHAGWLVPLLLAGWLVSTNYTQIDLSQDHEVARWAQMVDSSAAHSALLISGDDRHTFALDYLLWVEQWRRDLVVVDGELLAYPWYRRVLARRHPELHGLEGPELSQLIAANMSRRPVYLSTPRDELEARWEMQPQGDLLRVSELR